MRPVHMTLVLLAGAWVLGGCAQHTIDFSCDVPGEATMFVGAKKYPLPATITMKQSRKDLRFVFPTPDGKSLLAHGEIKFSRGYDPTELDRYGRLRAVFTPKLIETVEAGGAAVFDGYSVSDQHVFRLLFGKE